MVMSLEQAVDKFMEVTEFGGVRHECIGEHEISEKASMLPLMNEQEFMELCESIKEHGLLAPIKQDSDGKIVDGRNRLLACLACNIEPVWTFAQLSEIDEVITANLRRRNMTAGAKAMVWLQINGLPNEDSATIDDSDFNQVDDVAPTIPEPPQRKTMIQAAKEAGISTRVLQQATNVTTKASEPVKQAVAKGVISAEIGEALAKLPEEQQSKIVADPNSNVVLGKAKEARREVRTRDRWNLFDFSKWAPSFDKKVSVMLDNVPPDLRDRCQRHMAETLGSTVRVEKETEDLLNSESIVPYVEEIIAGLPKPERSSCEVAIGKRYSSVVRIKDAETALAAINEIVDGLSEVNKKKVATAMRKQFAPEPKADAPKSAKVRNLPTKPTAEVTRGR